MNYTLVFCVEQDTAYEMRISDWSSDVCSSRLRTALRRKPAGGFKVWHMVYQRPASRQCLSPSGAAGRPSPAALGRPSTVHRGTQIGRASRRDSECKYV